MTDFIDPDILEKEMEDLADRIKIETNPMIIGILKKTLGGLITRFRLAKDNKEEKEIGREAIEREQMGANDINEANEAERIGNQFTKEKNLIEKFRATYKERLKDINGFISSQEEDLRKAETAKDFDVRSTDKYGNTSFREIRGDYNMDLAEAKKNLALYNKVKAGDIYKDFLGMKKKYTQEIIDREKKYWEKELVELAKREKTIDRDIEAERRRQISYSNKEITKYKIDKDEVIDKISKLEQGLRDNIPLWVIDPFEYQKYIQITIPRTKPNSKIPNPKYTMLESLTQPLIKEAQRKYKEKSGKGIDNPELYEKAKELVYNQYPKHSAYRSGQLVKKYKEMGGTYSGEKPKDGLTSWFKEDWKDIGSTFGKSRAKDKKMYPVYRPTKRVNKNTPLTASEIDPVQAKKQIALKQIIKGTSNLPPFIKGTGTEGIDDFSNYKKAKKNAIKYLGKKIDFRISDKKDKKYMVLNPTTEKMIYFGQMGYEDFLKHQDPIRRMSYLKRTANIKGNWKDDPYSPNNLARIILWENK